MGTENIVNRAHPIPLPSLHLTRASFGSEEVVTVVSHDRERHRGTGHIPFHLTTIGSLYDVASEEGYHMPTVGLCARSLHSLPHPNRFNLNDNSQGRKDRSHRLSATLSARLRRGV